MVVHRYWFIFFVLHFISKSFLEAFAPYWPVWLGDHFGDAQSMSYRIFLSLFYIAHIFAATLSTVYWGRFIDRFNPYINWLRSLFFLGFFWFLMSFLNHIYVIIFVRFLKGFFAGTFSSVQQFASYLSSSNGLFRLQWTSSAGSILGPLIMGLLVLFFSFDEILMWAGVLLMVLVVGVVGYEYLYSKEGISFQDSQERISSQYQSDSCISFSFSWFFLLSFSPAIMLPVLADLTLLYSQSHAWIGVVYASLYVGKILSYSFWNKVLQKNYFKVIVFCLVAIVLSTVGQFYTDHIEILCLLRLLSGFFVTPLLPWSMECAIQSYVWKRKKKILPFNKGEFMGKLQFWQRLGTIAGFVVGSFLFDQSLFALGLSIVVYILSIILLFYLNILKN